MVNFFIQRPIFAIVLAIVLMLAGGLAIMRLPVAQYPTIAPPSIQIRAVYNGASAKTVENTVIQVIEQQMNGLDNLLYLSSTSDDAGTAQTTLTFAAGTDPNIAQVQVENKLQLAMPLLPLAVQQAGISVTKSSGSFLMIMAFISSDGSMSRYDPDRIIWLRKSRIRSVASMASEPRCCSARSTRSEFGSIRASLTTSG